MMHIYKCPLYKNSDYDHQVNSLVGWVSSLPHYSQMIRENNKWKRLLWCLQQTGNGEKFKDVIWSDECTVMIERKRKTYRRVGKPRKFKPKPKHPLKIHIWGAISTKGAAPLVLFSENLTAIRFGKIIEASLAPFIRDKFPVTHKLQMDNDPKHTSHYVCDFLKSKDIYWWKTPAESPDLNPIEKVWGSMKNFLRDVHFRKPENRNLAGLKDGIKKFWKTLTPKICRKYMKHIHKVMPIVIQNRGEASGH